MNTTALLIDILILGIQVILWVSGLIFSFVIPFSAFENFIKTYGVSSFLFIIPVAYPVGIIFDHLIKHIFGSLKSKEEREVYKDVNTIMILASDREVNGFLENAYARLRIARGTVFNMLPITISLSVFVGTNNLILIPSKCATIALILFSGIIMFLLALMSWRKRNAEYLKYIQNTKELKWYRKYLEEKESGRNAD